MTTTPINGDDFIASVNPTLKEHRVQICLRPDLLQRHEQLEEDLRKAVTGGAGARLNGGQATGTEQRKLAEDIQSLEAEIEAASAWFKFRAMPGQEFRTLCLEYPPRPGIQMDAVYGYDRDAVADVLIRKSLIDPVFTDAGWDRFMATCAPSEWAELRDGAYEANGGSFKPPKSLLASQLLTPRGSDSK